MDLISRSMGILVIDEGVVIRARPEKEHRTEIEVNDGHRVGEIVRDSTTGRWRYDETMRGALGITENPEFDTDYEAGDRIESYLPPLPQLRQFVLGLIDSRHGGHS